MFDKVVSLAIYLFKVRLFMMGQVAQAARHLAKGRTSRVRFWASQGWKFLFTPSYKTGPGVHLASIK